MKWGQSQKERKTKLELLPNLYLLQCYADGTIEDMREEKVIMDFPDIADKLIEMNSQVDNPEYKVVIDIPYLSSEAQGCQPCLCPEDEKV